MKVLKLLFSLLTVMSLAVFAQKPGDGAAAENPPVSNIPEAIKFFELWETNDRFLEAGLEDFWQEMKKNPNDLGLIINYGRDEETAAREQLIIEKIGSGRHHPARFTVVKGGMCEGLKIELWRVPVAARMPRPCGGNSTGDQPGFIAKPSKLEEFGKVSDRFLAHIFGEFFGKLDKEKNLNGLIVIRGTREDINEFEARIWNLELFQKQNSERISFIKTESAAAAPIVSLWLVPDGAELPAELKTQ